MSTLADTFGWELRGTSAQFDGVCIDSRNLVLGQLFVALAGENHDAHSFVPQALRDGAAGALVEKAVADAEPLLLAEDTREALGQLAAMHRQSWRGELFAVTGSAGKTTTKEMLAAILAQAGQVHATRGNFNNEIGVPLTLFQLRNDHRFAVIEMGAARPGDIAYLVTMARPTTSIITNAMPAHLEGFGSVERVAHTKGEIFVPDAACVAVINGDDPYAELWQRQAAGARIITYSAAGSLQADLRAEAIETGAAGVSFTLHSPDGSCDICLHVPGKHNVANALAAAGAALSRGISLAAVQAGLDAFSGVAGRLQFLRGRKHLLVIDDSYNANPAAVHAALDVLSRQAGKRVFLFGSMGELGERSDELHRQVGEYARECGIDLLLAVGAGAAQAAGAFGEESASFADHTALAAWLGRHDYLADFGACLVKGSRSAHMERAVELLVDAGGEH